MGARKRMEDFPQRLERTIAVARLSWEEFAKQLGVEYDRVLEWRGGAVPPGSELWHIMRLVWPVPGGIDAMPSEAAESVRGWE